MIDLSKTKPIEGFEDYAISMSGDVINSNTGLLRKRSLTQAGSVKITLFKNGNPHTKSLSLLVAKAWLYNDHDPEIFDTPIHLDNDTTNVHVDNLAWRPRWFAVKYQRQYWNEEFRYAKTRVVDTQTNLVYENLVDPCQKYGLLYMDIIRSCTRGDNVFPTWKVFRFAD